MLAAGERTSAIRGGGTDFESLREYRLDDEFRRINWKATARSSKPISNEYREDRNQQIVLLMDASRTMAATVDGVSRFEHALDAGFAVAQLASRAGDHVGMVAFDRDVVAMLAPRGGPAQPRTIVSMLFGLEPTLDAPNYGRAFTTLLTRHRRRSLLILLSEVSELSQIESLLRALPVLLARHLVLLATVRDPGVEAMATATPTSSEEAYAKAAAAGALLARDQATTRLKRLGVIVVDAPPGRLAGQLADRYLRIKATGRL
jgi:uncharacterized protein (DUF58 family)